MNKRNIRIIFVCISIFFAPFLLNLSMSSAQDADLAAENLANTLQEITRSDTVVDKGTILDTLGVPQDASQFNFWKIMSYFIFGGIGFVAFIYGKKNALWRLMLIGAVLNIYPYFISSTFLIYVVGMALTAAIFMWQD